MARYRTTVHSRLGIDEAFAYLADFAPQRRVGSRGGRGTAADRGPDRARRPGSGWWRRFSVGGSPSNTRSPPMSRPSASS